MAKTFFINGIGTAAAGTAITSGNDFPPGSNGFPLNVAVDANIYRTMRRSGEFSGLFASIVSNTRNGNTTFSSRKNGLNASQIVTVAAGATGVSMDNNNVDAVVSGSVYGVQAVLGGASGAINWGYVGGLWQDDSGDYLSTFFSSSQAFAQNNNTRYFCYARSATAALVSVETAVQVKFKAAGTLRNLQVYVSANSRTTDVTIRNRVNAANGNLTVTILAGVTGLIEDISNTDTIAANDLADYSAIAGASAETVNFTCYIDFQSATRGMYMGSNSNGTTVSNGQTYYWSPNWPGTLTFTQNQAQMPVPLKCTISNARVFILTNTANFSTVYVLQKNGVDTNISITVGAGVTGWVEDNTNTTDITKGDLINWRITSAAGSGSHTSYTAAFDYVDTTSPSGSGGANLLRLMGVGGSRGQAFSPSQLSGLEFWMRSDLGITLAGSNVSDWADQSSNGRNWTQGTAAARPQYFASGGINNRPYLLFDGIDDFFERTGLTLSGGMTLLLVFKLRSFTGGTAMGGFTVGDLTTATDFEFVNFAGYTKYNFACNYTGGTLSGPADPAFNTTDTQSWLITYNGAGSATPANYSLNVSGVSTAVIASGAGVSPVALRNVISLGRRPDTLVNFMHAEFYEALLFSNEKTGSNWNSLRSYLNSLYGL